MCIVIFCMMIQFENYSSTVCSLIGGLLFRIMGIAVFNEQSSNSLKLKMKSHLWLIQKCLIILEFMVGLSYNVYTLSL